jgi:chromatin structure-remodeling complex protein RSC7
VKAGDPIGDMFDISQLPPEGSAARAANNLASSNLFSSGTSMIYKPGGPSTYFGGPGLGPFSGDMAGGRRGALAREGVSEENWMWRAALDAREANETMRNIRQLRQIPIEGASSGISQQPLLTLKEATEITDISVDKQPGDEPTGDEVYGTYEPHTSSWHVRMDTQPTKSRYEAIGGKNHFVLGGTQIGTGAWGVLWVDTVMEDQGPEPVSSIPTQ